MHILYRDRHDCLIEQAWATISICYYCSYVPSTVYIYYNNNKQSSSTAQQRRNWQATTLRLKYV